MFGCNMTYHLHKTACGRQKITYRRATHSDHAAVVEILRAAIRRLGDAGVPQWQQGYPNGDSIATDILRGVGRVLCVGERVVAYGAVIATGEEAYNNIEGAWLTAGDYLVVHRLCVAEEFVGCGLGRHFLLAVEQEAAREGVQSVRVDTHADNRIMQHLLPALGYTYCGVIHYESPRMAFEKPIGV